MLGQEFGFEWVKENIKHCPISNSMDLLGKKFAVLILRNMIVHKQTRFNQFIDTIDGINPKTLTARLRELERSGLIGRKVYSEVPPRVEYFLTEKGMALNLCWNSWQPYPYKTILIKYSLKILIIAQEEGVRI